MPILLPILFVLVAAVPGVSAHADLTEAFPTPNTRLDEAPTNLTLRFTEELSSTYTTVEMLRNETDHVASVTIGDGDPRVMTATLHPIEDGVYSIKWRTLSSADGHTRSGAYLLAVGVPIPGQGSAAGPGAATGPTATASEEDVRPLEPVFRALGFAGASLALGIPLFRWLTAKASTPARYQQHLTTLTITGAATAAVCALGLLAGLAARIEASMLVAYASEPGRILVTRATLFAVAAILFFVGPIVSGGRHRVKTDALATLLAAGGLLATSMGGHAAATDGSVPLAIANDWLHQVAVAFWVAGVLALVIAAAADTGEATGAFLVRRFSPFAVTAVLVIIATGTIATLDRLPDRASLWSSAYGLALLAKLVLIGPLILLGAYHRYVLLPALDKPGDEAHDFRRLRVSAGIEVIGMALILVAAGLLTSFSPPLDQDAAAAADEEREPVPYYSFEENDLFVRVFLGPQPVTVGFQDMFVNITTNNPDVPLNRDNISVFLTLHEPNAAGSEATPIEDHYLFNETYHFAGALFTAPGNWTATLVIQGGQGEAYRYVQHDFSVEVREAEGVREGDRA